MGVPYLGPLSRLTEGYYGRKDQMAAQDLRDRAQAENEKRTAMDALLQQAQIGNYQSTEADRRADNARLQAQQEAGASELARKNEARSKQVLARVQFLATKHGLAPEAAQAIAEDDVAFRDFVKPQEETFTGQPYAARIGGKPSMAIRGSKGTIKVLEGQSPYEKPEQDGISGTFTAPDPKDPTKLVTMGYTKSGASKVLGPAVRTQGSRSEMQRMQAERSIAGTQLMVSAHKEMEKGEAQMAANPSLIKQFDAIKGEIMAHIPQGANINNPDALEQVIATASLYANNPVLANYIRNTMMYTFGQMETLPRTSDFRTRYEQQISGIKPNMPPDQISQVTRQRKAQIHIKAQTALSQSRDWGWDPDPETMEFVGSAKASPNTPAGAPQQKVMSRAAYDAALKAGHTDAEIKAAGWTVKP